MSSQYADAAVWDEIKRMGKANENRDRKMALLRDNMNETAEKLNVVMEWLDGQSKKKLMEHQGKAVVMKLTFVKSKADFIEFEKEEDLVG